MKGVLVVMTDPIAGKDDEFNHWYDTVHIPHVLAVPGFAAAQRFIAEPWRDGTLQPQRYLALYELDVAVDEALRSMAARRSTMPAPSPTLDPSSNVTYAYRAFRERVQA